AKGAQTGLIGNPQQKIGFKQRSWSPKLFFGSSTLGTTHKTTPPLVRSGIPQRTEHLPAGRRNENTTPHLE
ncbi:hypothetical protein, partial [Chlorobium limicola]|uniref:hypothetical protein n=1 Tax=Chlorobium limicola TaxID=1092 RepID=UPI000A6A8B6D